MPRGKARAALVAALASAAKEPEQKPLDCRLKVELRCAPDLDGDGQPETLVRAGWVQPSADDPANLQRSCTSPRLQVFGSFSYWSVLSRKPRGGWRARSHEPASLASGEVDLSQEVRDFVQFPEGRIGIRGTTRSLDAGSGCDVTSAWVKVLGPEGLETVREEDTHPPCPRGTGLDMREGSPDGSGAPGSPGEAG